MLVHGCAGLEILDAIAFRQDDFAVLVEGHAHAGNLPVGADLFDGSFNIGDDFFKRCAAGFHDRS